MARTDTLPHYLTDLANAIRTRKAENELPSAYQQIEYLQSSGTQYINTNILTDYGMGFEIEYEITGQSSFATLLGADPTYTTQRLVYGVIENGDINKNYLYAGNAGSIVNNPYAGLNIKTKAVYDNDILTISNANGTITATFSNPGLVNNETYPIYLFALNRRNNITDTTTAKIYSVSIKKCGKVVGRFIPCRRKSDNLLGMYNVVSQTFHYNTGSGSFTAGNDITPTPQGKIQASTFDTEIINL